MDLSLIKETFFSELKTLFSNDEIKAFWLWVSENIPPAPEDKILIWVHEIIAELKSQKPIQYIFGYGYFHRYKFKVNEHTLIPRPETEELCELILAENTNAKLRGIDIGTGSGCIPITLLAERSNWEFTGVDISSGAIQIAAENAKILLQDSRCQFYIQDFFKIINEANHYDLIIANPPYIHPSESTKLDSRVVNFEPATALFVKHDVLEYYRALKDYFSANTNPKAQLWLETHQDYCDDVVELFKDSFRAKKIEDFSQNPRFVKVTK